MLQYPVDMLKEDARQLLAQFGIEVPLGHLEFVQKDSCDFGLRGPLLKGSMLLAIDYVRLDTQYYVAINSQGNYALQIDTSATPYDEAQRLLAEFRRVE